jgi:hypothetical protein
MAEITFDRAMVFHFVMVTILLGGAAGWLTGRAIAITWRPRWMLLPAALGLGALVRFIHFALFDERLASLPLVGFDAAVAFLFALAGYHMTRSRQMDRQYGFLHDR